MESGVTRDEQPCIDLTHCHFRRVVGEFAVFGTWLRLGKESEPCLVITPSKLFEGKPAVIPLSAAWKYSQMSFADPKVVANQVREFAKAMNKDTLSHVIALTDLINDCLSDLISMPPDPKERLVVADAEITIDGKKRTMELTE